jgi:hypothetical protein
LRSGRGKRSIRSSSFSLSERIPSAFPHLGSIETALRKRGAQSAAVDDRSPRERREEDAFEMVKRELKKTEGKTSGAGVGEREKKRKMKNSLSWRPCF